MSAAHLSTSTLSTCRVGQFVSNPFPEQGSISPKEQPLFSYILRSQPLMANSIQSSAKEAPYFLVSMPLLSAIL
jgi:hypothetical protein